MNLELKLKRPREGEYTQNPKRIKQEKNNQQKKIYGRWIKPTPTKRVLPEAEQANNRVKQNKIDVNKTNEEVKT